MFQSRRIQGIAQTPAARQSAIQWLDVACTGTSIGEKGMMVAAEALMATAIDLFSAPTLVEKARADFKAIREPLEFVTLIPEGQKAPRAIR